MKRDSIRVKMSAFYIQDWPALTPHSSQKTSLATTTRNN